MFFQLIFDTEPTLVSSSTNQDTIAFVVLIGLGVMVIGLLMYGIRRARSAGSSNWELFERERLQKAWREVEGLAKQGSAAGRKLAVIEADKLVDTALRKIGFPGETMAERMKVAEYQFPAIRQMWNAHRWRNQLVHEAHFSLSERQVLEALRAYEEVMRQMRVL